MTTENRFPIAGTNAEELNPNLRSINIPEGLDFDIRDTYGEHALRAINDWYEFTSRAMETGDQIRTAQTEGFKHYLQSGPGRFYRAYLTPGDPIVAGLTLTPNVQRGYEVDHTYSNEQSKIAAAGYYAIFAARIFDDFSGTPPFRGLSNITIPNEKIVADQGLARAVMDFGLVNGDNFVIPMPGFSPNPIKRFNHNDNEKIHEAQAIIEEKQATGVISYYGMFANYDGWVEDATHEAYYRHGVYVGSATTLPIKGRPGSNEWHVEDMDGQTIETWKYVEFASDSIAQVQALRALAENHEKAAELILG